MTGAPPAGERSLSFLRLMAVTDNLRDGRDGLVARAAAAVRGGATCIQVRLKDATPREIVEVAAVMCRALAVPVIVNDRADLALAAGAAGVHLGPNDLPVKAVRRFVPPEFIIGASFGEEAEHPNAQLADYVGIGPVAQTNSKNDAGKPIGVAGFNTLRMRIGLPAVAIGGMDGELSRQAIAAGAAGIAVSSGIFAASDPERAARLIASAIGT